MCVHEKVIARRSVSSALHLSCMGLDATVYCDCYERGLTKEPPPCSRIVVADDGSIQCESGDLQTLLAFDEWISHRACDHPGAILLQHRIGNLAQVGLLRSELEHDPSTFPILLGKVLYSGSHTGDYLTLGETAALYVELGRLASLVCLAPSDQRYVQSFRQQMIELVETATRVRKPISF